MLKKRIIPCLDIKDGRTVKGVNFLQLKDAGDPVGLAKEYVKQGADEIVFLDISATVEERKTLLPLVIEIAKQINIPFAVGGGINSLERASEIIQSGADKVCLNSAAVTNPLLISQLMNHFGSQCVVVAIDAKEVNDSWEVFINGGAKPTGLNVLEWAKKVEELGAGELLITSMDHDGTKSGFAIELTSAIANIVNIPVIASGGGGQEQHFVDVFKKSNASAALAASIFHYKEISIPELKRKLIKEEIPVRCN